jgi:hypothetical protein
MALISPGLQLSVTDESQYVPGAVGSTPLVVLATAQDKTANGSYSTGTSKANAGRLQVFTSQRELVSALGYPVFKQSVSGTPIHGSPLNEYGLMAAYSTLATANRLYAIRADIDLNELEPTSVRPIGDPDEGTFWLDLGETTWGIYEWNNERKVFTEKQPIIITDEDDTVFSFGRYVPKTSIGRVGDYAVVISNFEVRVYVKDDSNAWRWVGQPNWQYRTHPSVVGTATSPTVTAGDSISINGQTITFTGSGTLEQVIADINAVFYEEVTFGVRASSTNGQLTIFVTDNAKSNGTDVDGELVIANGSGTALADLGLIAGTYYPPQAHYGSYVDVPRWGDTDPRPTGSVYFKTSAIGNGMNFVIRRFAAESSSWTSNAVPVYNTEEDFLFGMDPIAGGFGIAQGSIYAQYVSGDISQGAGATFTFFIKVRTGSTGQTRTPTGLTGGTFVIKSSESGTSGLNETTVVVANGTSIEDYAAKFVTAIAAANIPEVSARVQSNGQVSIVHAQGGVIYISNTIGTPLTSAGFTFANMRDNGIEMIVSNYLNIADSGFLAETEFTPPYKAPADGRLWYFSDPTQVDILINTGTAWRGYRNVATDARGYNLTLTDSAGPIITPSKPRFQNDGVTPLSAGDLWLDTSDLENFPKLSRYNTLGQWVAIDNTDRVSQNGIIFADARWDSDGTTDIIGEDLPGTDELLTSDYLDPDAPNPRLYPRGTLLFNTRRSGFNVKKYVGNYFNEDSFPEVDPSDLPDEPAAWVSVSGLKDSGAPFMGINAQRNMVVKAMRSALDGNTQVREDQFFFNLITAPGFPELITNMVALNNDRRNTAFVIGDTPMYLPANSIEVANWSNNTNGDGLSTADPYLGVFYPSGLTNDVQGNTIVVPASHMMLRTFIRNDNVAFPWFAPAGTRRGLIDNATDIGYINPVSGSFVRSGINQGMRDALYENRVNPLTILPGIGLVAWGQKTRNPTASSMDRINVARLVNYIRTILARVGDGFLFEPNDKVTRDQIKSIIEGAMNDLVAKRGIYDYLVVCDATNNTPERITRNELYVDIAIEPMKAVEFIYIPIRLKNPGDIAKLGG